MKPVLFQINGVLPSDKYLPGQYHWPVRVQIQRALLTCQPPIEGMLILTLEVNGVVTAFTLSVEAGGLLPVTLDVPVNITVPADSWVRWKAAFSSQPESAATQISLTLTVAPAALIVKPLLTVVWVDGSERLILYTYDAVTHTFTATGLAQGRASINTAGNQVSISIQSTEVLRVLSGVLYAVTFHAAAGVATVRSPRLQFCVDNIPIANLTTADLRVLELVEDTPASLSQEDPDFFKRFEFWSGGVLTAVLYPSGLIATGLQEGLL